MRVRKNHSSANLMHNQKLFNGDMLSFIKVAPVSSFRSLVVILVFLLTRDESVKFIISF